MTSSDPPLIIMRHAVDFPSDKAFGVQFALFANGLVEAGAEVWLSPGKWTVDSDAEVLKFYGLEPSPRLKLLHWPRFTRGLRAWRGWVFRRLLSAKLKRQRHRRPIVLFLDKGDNFECLLDMLPSRKTLNLRFALEAHSCHAGLYDIRMQEADDQEREKLKRGKWHHAAELEKLALPHFDFIFAVSQATVDGLKQVCPDGPEPVLMRNASVESPFPDRPLAERKGIVYPGHPFPAKGVDDLVAAMAKLPGVPLTIVGCRHQQDRDKVMGWAKQHGVEDRVNITGYVPNNEVFRYLSEARVGAIPLKRGGGSPMKAFEFMAAGLPFVGTDVPANREVVEEAKTGLLCEASNPESLADALRRMLEDEDLAEKHRQIGLEWIKDHTYKRRAERVLNMLNAIPAPDEA